MILHTVFVTRDRIDLTRQAISSYLETVTAPCTITVVDNASTDGTREWLRKCKAAILLDENRYPGFACNRGWEQAPPSAGFLHRADNDFSFLPGWCDEVWEGFQDPRVGQLGLRTDEEEDSNTMNVGGNCVIRRELWDAGLRYDETPWPEYPPGYSEDSFFSPAVKKMGWRWARVKRHIIQDLSLPDWDSEYYRRSYQDRNIGARLRYLKETT